jgi:hypothetical protein
MGVICCGAQTMSEINGSMSDLSPLSGEERKSNVGAAKSVDDPKRTSTC